MASPGAYVVEQDDRTVDRLNDAVCLLEMRSFSRTAFSRFFLDLIENERRRNFKLPPAVLGNLVRKIESFETGRRGGDHMRIWNRNYGRGTLVMAKYIGSQGARDSIDKFFHVRLIVFPSFPTDNARKMTLDGIALKGLYHLSCAVIFGTALYAAVC
jgi:hypothetical protein